MDYHRLKLTTKKGVVFLSPFIFTRAQAERRLKTSKWLVRELKNPQGKVIRSGKLEMVPVTDWPEGALYNYFSATDLDYLTRLERRWINYANGEDIEEVEEGSA